MNWNYNPGNVYIISLSYFILLFSIFHHTHYSSHTSKFTGTWIQPSENVESYTGDMVRLSDYEK